MTCTALYRSAWKALGGLNHQRLVRPLQSTPRLITRTGTLVPAATRQLGSVSRLVEGQYKEEKARYPVILGTALVGLLAASVTSNVTQAESVVMDEPLPEAAPSSAKQEEEDDPYANLPEDDEPTDCSMCKTFRQGPCRPYWRKLERCFKDHENEENGATKCMRYFHPHQQCLMEFINLYNLVRLTSLQEFIDETEAAFPAHQRTAMDPPKIDWSLWDQFEKDAGLLFSQGIQSAPKDSPLWKRFLENTEPVVLTFATQIPRVDESGLLLRFAYVLDQDGMVLGVESNQLYRQLKDKADGKEEEEAQQQQQHDEHEQPEQEPLGPHLNLEFYIIPSLTKQIQVKAMYAKDPTTPGVADDGRDDVLKATSLRRVGGQ